jgi:hypothetical protein
MEKIEHRFFEIHQKLIAHLDNLYENIYTKFLVDENKKFSVENIWYIRISVSENVVI